MTRLHGRAMLSLASGAACFVDALWNLSDQTICNWCADRFFTGRIYLWLFETFGHWGPRAALMAIGAFITAITISLDSLARESNTSLHSRGLHFLSWLLILLVLSLLLFVVAGPLLKEPWIDETVDTGREKYFAPLTFIVIAIVGLSTFAFEWQDYRETRDISCLYRTIAFSVLAIVLGGYLALGY